MLLVHGFPEFWYSWRHQLKEFGDQHRVVAMDMRGYGDSDSPQGKEHYKLHLLTTDIKETVEALGYTSCVLVAHDWGGALAWRVAHEYPEIVDKLIILNGPHSGVFKKYLRSHWSQFKKSLYMFFFQIPYVPELALRVNDMETLVSIFRSKQSGIKKPNMFTDEDVEAYKYTFGRPGAFTPPLNYYRNAFNKGQLSRSWIKKLTVPVLVIWGTSDTALESGLLDGIEEYVENLTIRRIEGASHWVQQEEPALVNSYIHQFVYSN